MIRVGIVGMGFMGAVHLRNWQAMDKAEVVAVCDAVPVTGAAKQGNIDAGSDELDLTGVAIHTDVAEMLASEILDAVLIALPTHLHKAVSILWKDSDHAESEAINNFAKQNSDGTFHHANLRE